MPDIVCSLTAPQPQTIPPGGSYVLVRFPFDGAESFDPADMHPVVQPDGTTATYDSPRSALIWPAHTAWGRLDAMLHWEESDYTEVRDQFVRDPLRLTTYGPDSTCTQDRAVTPGGQYLTKTWGLFVHPAIPLAVAVRHNAPRPVKLTFAEFKLSYRIDPAPVIP